MRIAIALGLAALFIVALAMAFRRGRKARQRKSAPTSERIDLFGNRKD